MLSPQSSSIESTKIDTPEPDGLPTDSDASLGQQIFDISVVQIESIVKPDCIANDIGCEPVALVGIHWPILPISASLLGNTFEAISPPSVF
jgi:hypothetical protein